MRVPACSRRASGPGCGSPCGLRRRRHSGVARGRRRGGIVARRRSTLAASSRRLRAGGAGNRNGAAAFSSHSSCSPLRHRGLGRSRETRSSRARRCSPRGCCLRRADGGRRAGVGVLRRCRPLRPQPSSRASAPTHLGIACLAGGSARRRLDRSCWRSSPAAGTTMLGTAIALVAERGSRRLASGPPAALLPLTRRRRVGPGGCCCRRAGSRQPMNRFGLRHRRALVLRLRASAGAALRLHADRGAHMRRRAGIARRWRRRRRAARRPLENFRTVTLPLLSPASTTTSWGSSRASPTSEPDRRRRARTRCVDRHLLAIAVRSSTPARASLARADAVALVVSRCAEGRRPRLVHHGRAGRSA